MVTVVVAQSGRVVIRGAGTGFAAQKALAGWARTKTLALPDGTQEAVWVAPANYLKVAESFAAEWNRDHPAVLPVRRRTFTGSARQFWCDDCDDGAHCHRCNCCNGVHGEDR